MSMHRPNWVQKYTKIGFPNSWADSVLEAHTTDLPQQLSDEIAPENFIGFDPLEIEDSTELLSDITVPQGYTVSEVILFTLDLLDSFGRTLPQMDSELYSVYQQLLARDEFEITVSFDDFYVFCRRIQYTDITQTREYHVLSEAVTDYTSCTIPLPESTWEVPYEDGRIAVYIHGLATTEDTDIIDPPIRGKVVDIIGEVTTESIHTGDELVLEPAIFEDGEQRK